MSETLPLGKHLVLPLSRPQYVSYPEALPTAIAWSNFQPLKNTITNDGTKKAVALMFEAGTNTSKVLKTLTYLQTRPDRDSEKLAAFAAALETAGLSCQGPQEVFARAASTSVLGVKSNKSPNQPAAPITEALALLQNDQGFLGAANPPAMWKILESLFGLGATSSAPPETVAELWRGAVEHRVQIDRVARALDQAARTALIDFPLEATTPAVVDTVDWAGLLDGTPFSWFRRTWKRLTSTEWVEALPARVWVDWASTVLRTAIGTGFLWEAVWYETVARTVLRGAPSTWESLRNGVVEVMPWKPAGNDLGVRDVSSTLLWRVRRSNQVKEVLLQWMSGEGCASEPLQNVTAAMASDAALQATLESALMNKSRGSKNLWESIKYSLMAREETGDFADHYGLLRSRPPRYLLPDPGTEWMAVVSSLCVQRPKGQAHLRDVMRALNECGLRPELSEVTALLERAGLARGSADADEGVVVQSAF